MEACASAHHWGQPFIEMGYAVALIPPQHVKAFCRVHKSDGHDAIAIGEAAQRPNLHMVPVNSIGQQDLAMLMHLRDRITRECTRTANQMRGFAAEYGLCFPKKISMLLQGITDALAKDHCGLSPVARVCIAELMEHIKLFHFHFRRATRRRVSNDDKRTFSTWRRAERANDVALMKWNWNYSPRASTR